LGEDLRYIHFGSLEDDKKHYLEKLSSGNYYHHGLDVLQSEFRFLRNELMINGDLRIEVKVKGNKKVLMSSYLQFWATRLMGCQIVSCSSVQIPQ